MALDTTTAITVAGVFPVWDEGASERPSRKGSTATRRLLTLWELRWQLASALIGQGAGSGLLVSITAAEQYPDAPWLFAHEVDMEGVGKQTEGANGQIAYEWARLTVEHRSLEASFSGGISGSLQIDFAADALSVPQDEATFKWESDDEDVPPEASPQLSIAVAQLTIPQRDLPEIRGRVPNILALFDHVNEDTLFGAPAGHMLYKGCRSIGRVMDPGGSVGTGSATGGGIEVSDLLHSVLWRSVPWNKFLRPSTGTWENIVYKATGQPYFAEGNLSFLEAVS